MLAMLASSRPWIDVFALPGDDSKNVNNFLNDCATSELSMRACNWNVTDSKKLIRLDYSGTSLRYDRLKIYPTILYGLNLWLTPVSATAAG